MPAPRPISVPYNDFGLAGLLAVKSGEGMQRDRLNSEASSIIAIERQRQMQEAQLRAQQQANSMQMAYADKADQRKYAYAQQRDQMQYGQPSRYDQQIQQKQLQAQQLQEQLAGMVKRGTISAQEADRVKLGQLGVPSSLAKIGIDDSGPEGMSFSQRRLGHNDQFEAKADALEVHRKMIEGQMDRMLQPHGGDLIAAPAAVQQKYEQLGKELEMIQRKSIELYQNYQPPQDMVGGGGMSGAGMANQQITFDQAKQIPGALAQNAQGETIYFNGRGWVPAK